MGLNKNLYNMYNSVEGASFAENKSTKWYNGTTHGVQKDRIIGHAKNV